MWKMAERFGVDGVRDLTDQQYDDCLRKVHTYFSMNPGQWQQGKVKKVEKGKGPAHHRERAHKGAGEMKHEKECYKWCRWWASVQILFARDLRPHLEGFLWCVMGQSHRASVHGRFEGDE